MLRSMAENSGALEKPLEGDTSVGQRYILKHIQNSKIKNILH